MFSKPKRSLLILTTWLAVVCATKASGGVPAAEGEGLLNLDWRVYVAAKPVYCLLVEKDRQRLRVLRHDGRLQVVAEYQVATGENSGPKEQEGDARTPEGIYLVTKGYLDTKISIFGNRAYQLNYPNWFDLGAGRGGNGIYLHGTNKPLQPMSSNGCVTLQNSDLERLADYLTVGTPVFIVPTLTPSSEGEGQEGYPDLTGGDFAGARTLLLPEGEGTVDFASLYLIRIKGQTMVAGEYWATPDNSAPLQAVAYLHQAPDKRWAVVDRGPAAVAQEREEMVTIAGLPPELQREVALEAEGDWPSVFPLLWEPAPESLTLEWFREATVPLPPPVQKAAVAVAAPPAGVGAEVVYTLFGLATCLSIGSALFLIRRQGAGEGGEGGAEGDTLIERVRDEVTQARESLQTVQAQIDKEARLMESQEALKARVEGLEEAFGAKQAAIERLSAEQAALREQGLSERSGLVEELGQVRGELAAVRAELEKARQQMAASSEQAGEVHEQLAEVKRLATERQEAAMNAEALKGVVAEACDQLREQVQAMLETLPRAEASHGEESEEGGRYDGVMAEIRAYAVEMRAAQAEMASRLGGVADSGELAAALEELRQELREAERQKTELLSRLPRLSELEASLAERDRELLALRAEGEEARGRVLAVKGELESRLAGLDEELRAERAAKTELTSRLTRLSELEALAAERERALLALREEGEMTRKRAVSEKVELESRLAALGEELQAEREAKRELAGRLPRLSEVEAALAERDRELLSLREANELVTVSSATDKSRLQATIAELVLARQADEETSARVVTEKMELESRLAALSEELGEEREAKRELAGRLTRLSELEAALAERDRELLSLREANELVTTSSATDKGRLEATIAELVLARQVEVTSLSTAAQEAKEKAAAEQEAMAALRREVETVQEALRQATELEQAAEQRSRDQERVVAELGQEIAGFKVKVAELEQKATMGDGVVLIKGSHYLPGDVLRKWIGKEG